MNMGFLIIVNLLIKPFYIFGIDRTVQNVVAAEEYGLFFTLFNFAFLFQIINDFGLQNFNNRHLSQHRQLLAKYFPAFLSLKLLLALLYLLVVLLVAANVTGYPPHYFHLLTMVGINWILLSLVLFLRSNVSGLGWYRTDSLLSVLDRTLMIVVCGLLLWVPSWRAAFKIEWFVYAQTLTLSLTAIVAFAVIFRSISGWRFRFQPLYLLLILRKSYPYALVVFLMTLYTRIDSVMIERLLVDGIRQAGIYAMAYRLLDAANVFGFLVAGLLLPMFARLLGKNQTVFPLLHMSYSLVGTVSITLAAAVFCFREEIMTGLYLEGDAYSGEILGYLILSFIAVCGTYIHGTLLTANGSLRRMNTVFVFGVLLNIGLNLWLIPRFDALGAAVATCITQFIVWLAQIELVRRLFDKSLQWKLLLRFLLFGALTAGTFYWIRSQGQWWWWYRFLLCFPLGGMLAMFLGIVKWRPALYFLFGRDSFDGER